MMYESKDKIYKEFADRTRQNYERFKDGPYEVTLLINSMVGLLIIPEQTVYNKICDSMISEQLLEKLKQTSCLKSYNYKDTLNLKQICRHLRNAIAHSHIKFIPTKSVYSSKQISIKAVTFHDMDGKGHKFEMELEIDLLKEFLFAFSDSVSSI